MATIHVDGKTLEVDGADNLLQACLSLGLDIPYFCWHPALGSVGACRQCAVKQYTDENDKRGRLVMSCMTPATDNTWISIEDEEAKQFRASVVEWLMTNHPHDCPVCEEGGHCHLQDMTVMTGHNERRYRFTKRTHQNQELGPFIAHEMNRCIACYRCVRYYKDYAGGTDLGVYGAHDNVYFGRVEDGVLESEFSGNLTEVCPTGVFTDKTHSERYNRKWDMQFAPSICHGCSSGCNISPGERYGEIRRIENRYNGSVNHYFLCDRGRFGYGYVNREDRPRQPLLVLSKQKLSLDGALDQAAALLKERKVVGIGSPRASLESNFALRELVGEGNFYSGINEGELDRLRLILQVMQEGPLPVPSIRDIEDHDAVFVLGEDLTQTAARIALALRQSVKGKAVEMAADMKVQPWLDAAVKNIAQHAQNPLFIASVSATRLDDVAEETVHAAPDDLARLGFAVAHAIDPSAPSVADLDPQAQAMLGEARQLIGECQQMLVQHIADLDEFAWQGGQRAQVLYDAALASRMRPFADVLSGQARMVRDLGRSLGKQVRLLVEGESTQVDRDVLEKLEAPLTHLLRNAVDHGIEAPETRLAAGKPAEGRITIRARHHAGMLVLELSDDGGGIDLQRLRETVLNRQFATAETVAQLSEEELLAFLFLPGFSMREQVTEVSGRGVGLDAVQHMVRQLRGGVRMEQRQGQGALFHVEVPLTLSVVRSLVVEIGEEAYAFPLAHIERMCELEAEEIVQLEGRQHFWYEGRHVGLVSAAQLLQRPESSRTEGAIPVVVVRDRDAVYGVAVERFVGERTLVVMPLDPRLGKVRDVSAGALLDDGSPVLILDVEDLLHSVGKLLSSGRLERIDRSRRQAGGAQRKRILVVDDSLTVRELERKLLLGRGYDVAVAVDGMDGWNALRSEHFDLLITDIDMPRMDGIELVTLVRRDSRLQSLPVMVVSYKDREEDRRRGLDAGADYYLAKASFHDEALLDAVVVLIGEAQG